MKSFVKAHSDGSINTFSRGHPLVDKKKQCKLTCRAVGKSYYFTRDNVIDGTPCNEVSTDICVDGQCMVSWLPCSKMRRFPVIALVLVLSFYRFIVNLALLLSSSTSSSSLQSLHYDHRQCRRCCCCCHCRRLLGLLVFVLVLALVYVRVLVLVLVLVPELCPCPYPRPCPCPCP